jgi:hypothetical protein
MSFHHYDPWGPYDRYCRICGMRAASDLHRPGRLFREAVAGLVITWGLLVLVLLAFGR